MKLNKKGFAITAILYGLLILFVFLVGSYLLILSARKNRVDSLIENVEKEYASKYTVDIYLANSGDLNFNTSSFVILDNGQMKDSNGTSLGYHATFTVPKGSSIELFEIDPYVDDQGWILTYGNGYDAIYCDSKDGVYKPLPADAYNIGEFDYDRCDKGNGNDIIKNITLYDVKKNMNCYIFFKQEQGNDCKELGRLQPEQ